MGKVTTNLSLLANTSRVDGQILGGPSLQGGGVTEGGGGAHGLVGPGVSNLRVWSR